MVEKKRKGVGCFQYSRKGKESGGYSIEVRYVPAVGNVAVLSITS